MKKTSRIMLLGPIAIEREGMPLSGFESRKALALLCFLALEDKAISRSYLAGLFWGYKSEDRARNNLSRVLSNISSRIPDCLEADRQSVRFRRSADCWIDTDAFAALEEQNDAESWTASVEICRGEIMEGLFIDDCPEFDLWLLAKRETWRQRVTNRLRYLIDHYLEVRNYHLCMDYSAKLLELEPWREEAHRTRMLLLARSGQRTSALSQYEMCRNVLVDELGVPPSEETTALYNEILNNQIEVQHPGRPRTSQSLPVPATDFVGRKSELTRIAHCLSSTNSRLLTLAGVGGAGKSRLALQAITEYSHHSSTRTVFVSLDEPAASDSLETEIVSALGLSKPNTEHLGFEQIYNELEKQHSLLLIDGFSNHQAEHQVLADLLQNVPDLRILITTRSRIRMRGEWVLDVAGMEYPQNCEDQQFEHYDAIKLFTQASQRVKADFTLLKSQRASLIRICELVGGLPLALELAADWVRIMTLDEIAYEVERDLDFLTSTMQDMPTRHHSLREIFNSTWPNLAVSEQSVLTNLAIHAAQKELHTGNAKRTALASLADRNLIYRDREGRFFVQPVFNFFVTQMAGHN